jgi:peptidoglycan/xylan/chitin deacetylase (PgdA/CDA1 family)
MKKKILVIILIILNIFLLIHGNRETEKYIIQDDYKFILSYPLIKNKKIDLKINNFVEENKKIYNQNSDNIKSMIVNYEIQEYKNITFVELNSFIYYEDDYVENNEIISFKTDTKEILKLKDIFNTPYYISKLTTKTINQDKQQINEENNFILSKSGLVIKYNYLNKIKEYKINYDEIETYLKEEYKMDDIVIPVLTPTKRNLNKYKNKKLIALTFDDGPSNNTKYFIKELQKRDALVTFFVVGNRVKKYEDVLKETYLMGNQIGSHTYSHKNLLYLNEEEITKEIEKTNEAIYNVIGTKPTIIRVPYGNINKKIRSISNMNHILWNVDTLDWKYKNSNRVYKEIIKHAEDGNIILLHDIFKTSVNGVLKAIDELKKQGYEFVTIDEMVYLKNIKLDKSKTYFNFK